MAVWQSQWRCVLQQLQCDGGAAYTLISSLIQQFYFQTNKISRFCSRRSEVSRSGPHALWRWTLPPWNKGSTSPPPEWLIRHHPLSIQLGQLYSIWSLSQLEAGGRFSPPDWCPIYHYLIQFSCIILFQKNPGQYSRVDQEKKAQFCLHYTVDQWKEATPAPVVSTWSTLCSYSLTRGTLSELSLVHFRGSDKFTQAHCDFTLIANVITLLALIKATLSAFPSSPVIWVMYWHQRRRNSTAQADWTHRKTCHCTSSWPVKVFDYYLSCSLLPQSKVFFLSHFFFFFFSGGDAWLYYRVKVGWVGITPPSPWGRKSSPIKIPSCDLQMVDVSSLSKLTPPPQKRFVQEWTGKENGTNSIWAAVHWSGWLNF